VTLKVAALVKGSAEKNRKVNGAVSVESATEGHNALLQSLLAALRAASRGEFSVRMPAGQKAGLARHISEAFNDLLERNSSLARELARVERAVGREGRLGERAALGHGAQGGWASSVEAINALIGDLVRPTVEVARVVGAIASGDLSQRMSQSIDGQPLKGEFCRIGETVNAMVDQLSAFAAEVARVAKEVGNEGKLGGQAIVPKASGLWRELTDNVNQLAENLTSQVRNIAEVTTAVANGDLSRKISVDARGEVNELKNTINTMVDQLRSFASEVSRVAREVGTEGKLGGQADVRGVSGTWKDLTDNVNVLAANLTDQVRNIAKVTTAVAKGDLSQKISVDVKGEILELKNTINTMVDQLRSFAGEVTRVAKEVGSEGKLGGQAEVFGVSGTWKDLTDNVNTMASNLTTQVRGIVKVVTAVANGDLSQKLFGVEAKGEIAALADTINGMCDTLGTFADQVSTVAREVGIEGKLGGQANVPGATGTWRQLTDNVNQLAANLTDQVRAISDVATAVTKGDLTQSIQVQARGEVALLKDTINQMIVNLKQTTQKNTEQDWLKTNLARFSGMMQGQKTLEAVSDMIMSELTPLVSAHHGAFFVLEDEEGAPILKLKSTYAYRERKHVSTTFHIGESLVGQCAKEKKPIVLTQVPADYVQISSGLGEAPPLNIVVLPVLFEREVKAVIELASFHAFSPIHQLFLDQLMVSVGVVLNVIKTNMRTEQLLLQSQSLTQELQSQSKELQLQQQELRRTNLALEKQALELEEKARLLAQQNAKVEIKNREVEQAKRSLEEKAEQLGLASKYKSEFLANMSHELRTPLNSLLILARLLADNPNENLSQKEIEYARTIYTCGTDLLSLINEILDLSKVESGKLQVEPRAVLLSDLVQELSRAFQALADEKAVTLTTHIEPGTSETIFSDPQRLQQILRNLLSNAFKFTDDGSVALRIRMAQNGSTSDSDSAATMGRLVAFDVIDSGIGIAPEKQKLIFEAFQQADGTTSRKYGGTGLGLTISRDIARLLGGELRVSSTPNRGSTFTLLLPESYNRRSASEEVPGLPEGQAERPVTRELTASFERSEHLLPAAGSSGLEDDRASIVPGDRTLLVMEDDEHFAGVLMAIGRQQGFKVVVATRGDTGLALAVRLRPSAIALDIKLPVYDGWAVLDRLKRDPLTRHIPVQVISVVERSEHGALLDAFAYLEKPVTKEVLDGAFAHLRSVVDRTIRVLLLVEDSELESERIARSIAELGNIEVLVVTTAEQALWQLERRSFDCLLVDLVLPGLDGIGLIGEVKRRDRLKTLPIVVYAGKDLDPEEERKLKQFASSVVVKSGQESLDELARHVSRFLHRAVAHQRTPPDAELVGKTVLIVDNDVRNIFALSSALESAGLRVLYAESGRAAIEALGQNCNIHLVFMDIMMPEMDGYETIRAIRQDPALAGLPIVALTARALSEDRDHCLAAGASDYVSKPVDVQTLLAQIRRWTSNARSASAATVLE
jgi:signal transduction histidine kinase/CheY-like chemotaxis protein/HAMP domain-containing protein